MFASGIASGHPLAADWLFLIAAILFVLAAVINIAGGTIAARFNPLNLAFVASALIAFGLLVL